jgi:hypothetical protein
LQVYTDPRDRPYVTTRSLLLTMSARLDRQEEQLASMSTKLQQLASTLERRLSSALVGSELSSQLAAMEQRLAHRIDQAKGATAASASSERRQANPAPADPPPSSLASPRSQGSATDHKADERRGAPARHGHPQLTGVYTLRHSFLRRFVGSDEEEPAAARSVSHYRHRMAGLTDRLLESVFGICEADPKVGKEGSRVIHPQSHFVTGEPESESAAPPPAGA